MAVGHWNVQSVACQEAQELGVVAGIWSMCECGGIRCPPQLSWIIGHPAGVWELFVGVAGIPPTPMLE